MNTATTTTTTTSPSSNMLSIPSSSSSSSTLSPTRPAFNSQRTQDRLREGEGKGLYAVLFRSDSSNLQRGRKSVFKETGLDNDESSSEVADILSLTSPVASPLSASQESSPFPSLQPRPLDSWYVLAALFACFGPR